LFWLGKEYVQVPLYIGFAITGLTLFSLKYAPRNYKKFSWDMSDAVILGLVQALSLIPGVSRFATTYSACSFLRYKPQHKY